MLAVTLAAAIGFGSRPAHGNGDLITTVSSVVLFTPQDTESSSCSTLTSKGVWTITSLGGGITYYGPMPVDMTGWVCGLLPGPITGNVGASGSVDVGVATLTLSCSGFVFAAIGGAVDLEMGCTMTITTPLGTSGRHEGCVTVTGVLAHVGVPAGAMAGVRSLFSC